MKKLIDFEDDAKFYQGTIIVLKNFHNTPNGTFDVKYGIIGGFMSHRFLMLNLYNKIGGYT